MPQFLLSYYYQMQFDLLLGHLKILFVENTAIWTKKHLIQCKIRKKIAFYQMLFDLIQLENRLYKMFFDFIQIENRLYTRFFDFIQLEKKSYTTLFD